MTQKQADVEDLTQDCLLLKEIEVALCRVFMPFIVCLRTGFLVLNAWP
jgi:hypothetical protein